MGNSPLLFNIHTLYKLLNIKDCYLSLQSRLTRHNLIIIKNLDSFISKIIEGRLSILIGNIYFLLFTITHLPTLGEGN